MNPVFSELERETIKLFPYSARAPGCTSHRQQGKVHLAGYAAKQATVAIPPRTHCHYPSRPSITSLATKYKEARREPATPAASPRRKGLGRVSSRRPVAAWQAALGRKPGSGARCHQGFRPHPVHTRRFLQPRTLTAHRLGKTDSYNGRSARGYSLPGSARAWRAAAIQRPPT